VHAELPALGDRLRRWASGTVFGLSFSSLAMTLLGLPAYDSRRSPSQRALGERGRNAPQGLDSASASVGSRAAAVVEIERLLHAIEQAPESAASGFSMTSDAPHPS
jgi:hypothetical protein